MLVHNRSQISGDINTMDLNVTSEQITMWQEGGLIQHVMPHLSPEEREFLMTGITPAEWSEEIA